MPTDLVAARCAFCHGTGTDPYNLLSERSRCEVCRGRREVRVPAHAVPCVFCRASGSFKTFSCPVCRGKGLVEPVPEPARICSECSGQGCAASSGLPCLVCRGRGRVAISSSTEPTWRTV